MDNGPDRGGPQIFRMTPRGFSARHGPDDPDKTNSAARHERLGRAARHLSGERAAKEASHATVDPINQPRGGTDRLLGRPGPPRLSSCWRRFRHNLPHHEHVRDEREDHRYCEAQKAPSWPTPEDPYR